MQGRKLRVVSGSIERIRRAPAAVPRLLARLPGLIVSAPRAAALVLIACVLVVFALAGGYFFWLRDSSLVRVETVTVSGVTIKDGDRLRAALTRAAQRMTVLDVRTDQLVRVAAPWRSVRAIEASAALPHEVHLRVIEYDPVAVAVGRDRHSVPVGADGTVFDGFPLDRPLPVLLVASPTQPPRLAGPDAAAMLATLAAAPPELRPSVTQLRLAGDRGVTVTLARGPDIVFGDGTDGVAKWQAAARLLADPASAKARYLDVSVPQRPAAGGLA